MSTAPAPANPSAPSPTSADIAVRRFLRVEPVNSPGASREASRAMSSSIFLSAMRCTLTYLVIPIAGPALHFSNTVGRPLSIALCLLAGYFSVRSMRRFWAANHRYRWAYSAFAVIVLAYMTYGVISDIGHLL